MRHLRRRATASHSASPPRTCFCLVCQFANKMKKILFLHGFYASGQIFFYISKKIFILRLIPNKKDTTFLDCAFWNAINDHLSGVGSSL